MSLNVKTAAISLLVLASCGLSPEEIERNRQELAQNVLSCQTGVPQGTVLNFERHYAYDSNVGQGVRIQAEYHNNVPNETIDQINQCLLQKYSAPDELFDNIPPTGYHLTRRSNFTIPELMPNTPVAQDTSTPTQSKFGSNYGTASSSPQAGLVAGTPLADQALQASLQNAVANIQGQPQSAIPSNPVTSTPVASQPVATKPKAVSSSYVQPKSQPTSNGTLILPPNRSCPPHASVLHQGRGYCLESQ